MKRCRKNEEADKVILTDADSEVCDNVVIIDIPESLPKRNKEPGRLKKDEKLSFRDVINIDDDETSDSRYHFDANNVSFSASSSSSRESVRIAEGFADYTYASVEDWQFVRESR